MEKTEKQWQKLGFTPKDGIKGVKRTQQFGSKYIYFTEDEVRHEQMNKGVSND